MFLLVSRARCAATGRILFNRSIRSYAQQAGGKTAPPRPLPPSSPPKSLLSNAPKPSIIDKAAFGSKASKINLAEEMFNAGRISLYEAPRRLTYFRLQNWIACSLFVAFLQWFYAEKLWSPTRLAENGIKYPTTVAVAYTVSAALIAPFAGFFLIRARNHVHCIHLVKQADTVFVRISMRTVIPFVKHHVAVRPNNLLVKGGIVGSAHPPLWMLPRELNKSSTSAVMISVIANTFRAIPRLFWNFFDSTRHFILQDSIATMYTTTDYGEKLPETACYFDLKGTFSSQDDGDVLYLLCEIEKPGQA